MAPSGDQIWNKCKWRNLVTKFWTYSSGAIWWPNFELTQVAPSSDQIRNECQWRDLVTKFRTNSSGAIWWPNLQLIQVVPLKSILSYSSWKIYSSYEINTLGPLCLWQCFISFINPKYIKCLFVRMISRQVQSKSQSVTFQLQRPDT